MLAALWASPPASCSADRTWSDAPNASCRSSTSATPSPLAVLAIALGILGIGSGLIFALFLASLLPIVRNTYEGLKNVQGRSRKPPPASA
jgi:ABC-type proline/glycine betaine transport system permease subunit